jgi:ribosome-binding factor A
MSRRSARVGDVLRQEIADVILRRIRDPRVQLATVSSVDVSPDLRHATVRVSVLGAEPVREECLEALRHAAGYIRSQLARNLRNMRVLPELIFELDRGPEYSHKIDQLLEHLHDAD